MNLGFNEEPQGSSEHNDWREREREVPAERDERVEKPHCTGYIVSTEWDQRGHSSGISAGGISAVHRTYDAQHVEICGKQRQEGFRQESTMPWTNRPP